MSIPPYSSSTRFTHHDSRENERPSALSTAPLHSSGRKRAHPEIVNPQAQELVQNSRRHLRRRKNEFNGKEILSGLQGYFRETQLFPSILKTIQINDPLLYRHFQQDIVEALKNVSAEAKERGNVDASYINFLYWCSYEIQKECSDELVQLNKFFFLVRSAVCDGLDLADLFSTLPLEEYFELVKKYSYEDLKQKFHSYVSYDYINTNLEEIAENYLNHIYILALEHSEAISLAEELEDVIRLEKEAVFFPDHWAKDDFLDLREQSWTEVSRYFSSITDQDDFSDFEKNSIPVLEKRLKDFRMILQNLSGLTNFWYLFDENGDQSLLGKQFTFLVQRTTQGEDRAFFHIHSIYDSFMNSLRICKKEFPDAIALKEMIRKKIAAYTQKIVALQPQGVSLRSSFYDIYQKELFDAGWRLLYKWYKESNITDWNQEISSHLNKTRKRINKNHSTGSIFNQKLKRKEKYQMKMMYEFWFSYQNQQPHEILTEQIEKLDEESFQELSYTLGHLDPALSDKELFTQRSEILMTTVLEACPNLTNPFKEPEPQPLSESL